MIALGPTYDEGVATTYKDPATETTRAQWSGVIPTDSLGLWQIEAVIGVLNTAKLHDNWDGYGSPSPSHIVVDTAIGILATIDFDDLPVPHVAPVSGGGIQIEWSFASRELELEILPDGSAEYLKAERGQPLEEGKLSPKKPAQVQPLFAWLISR